MDEFQSMYNYLSLHKTIQHIRDKILIKQKTGNLKFNNIRDLARIKAYKIKNLEHGCMLSFPKTLVCSWMNVVSKSVSRLDQAVNFAVISRVLVERLQIKKDFTLFLIKMLVNISDTLKKLNFFANLKFLQFASRCLQPSNLSCTICSQTRSSINLCLNCLRVNNVLWFCLIIVWYKMQAFLKKWPQYSKYLKYRYV